MSEIPPAPLTGNPEREAVDSMRGYSYQVLRSIEAWIDLRDGEILVVEGAEDLDRLTVAGATVEQVKDTAGSGNVTLRSKSVLEAIGNFWEHRERNDGVAIQFRFLTTAGVGREKKSPFTFDDSGLEAWRRIQAAPTATDSFAMASSIQSFLQEQTALPSKLRDWLKSAKTEAFIGDLILPIQWITGWPDWSGLHKTVLAKLVELAASQKIGPADAAKALDALHAEAWRVATTKGDRTLRRGDLLRIVASAGTIAVPNQQLLEIIGMITGAPTGGTAAVSASPEPFTAAPRQPPKRHRRPLLESSIAKVAKSGSTVLIHGGTGMGKTGLALTAVGHPLPVAWVDLRDVPASAAAARIDHVADRLTQHGQPHDVVIDDLPAAGDSRSLEAPLGRLRSVLDRLSGALIVTHSDVLPTRIVKQLSLHSSGIFAAPAFEVEDIQDYLIASGCPDTIAETWAKIIRASTSGHPQLVDARVSALVDAGFPTPDITELITPRQELVDVRAEARRLVACLHSDDRELLARSSLALGRIPRARLMGIALLEPAIVEPGDVIDRLVGPWLERTDTEDLRPSPLLRNLGTDTRGPEWVRDMHRGIGFSFLRSGGLLATDVFEIATHAMLAGTAAPLIPLLPSLLQASPDVWAQVAESSSMLLYVGLDENTSLPFADPNDAAAFRVLQLRIAQEAGNDDRITKILDCALREFDAAGTAQHPGTGLFELLFLWQLLQHPSALSLADRLRLSVRFVSTGARVGESFTAIESPEAVECEEWQWPDLSAFIPMALIPAVTDVERLTELLDLIEELDPAERAQALGGYAGKSEAAALAMDRVWLGEATRDVPRWTELADALRRIQALAGDINVPALADAAAPLLIRVLDENVRDPDAALKCADHLIGTLGRAPRLLAAKARVLWRQKRATEALPLYDEALIAFPLGLSWKTDVLRDAAIAAGKAEDWGLAARRLMEALTSLSEGEPLARRVGFLYDLAIALHLSGQERAAVDRLGEATDLLVADGQDLPAEPLVSIRQLGSQVVRTIGAEMGESAIWGEDEMPLERLYGSTSGMEELTWGGQQPASLGVVVLLMAELDLLMPEYPNIAERLAPGLRASDDLLVQTTQGDMLTRLAMRTLNVTDSASDAMREVRALAAARAERDAGHELVGKSLVDASGSLGPAWQEMIKYRLMASVVAMLTRCKAHEIPAGDWLNAIPADGTAGDLRAMLEDLGRLIAGTEDASARIMGGNASWDRHLLAVLFAPVQRHLPPDKLLICHSLAARYLHQSKLAEFAGGVFSDWVTKAWLDQCESPAQLVAPRFTVPAIRQAATNSAAGWPRILAVLEAARSAVSTAASNSLTETLRELREKIVRS